MPLPSGGITEFNKEEIVKHLNYLSSGPDDTGWKARHLLYVSTTANPVITGMRAWITYAEAHQRRYGNKIGNDSVLGPAWAQWGAALRQLLTGFLGDADTGTLDTIINDNLKEQGFDPDTL